MRSRASHSQTPTRPVTEIVLWLTWRISAPLLVLLSTVYTTVYALVLPVASRAPIVWADCVHRLEHRPGARYVGVVGGVVVYAVLSGLVH